VTLRLLLIEHKHADAELTVDHLRSSGLDVAPKRVAAPDDFALALSEMRPHAILSNGDVPEFSALDALRLLEEQGLPTPFIVITDGLDHGAAVEYMRAGADDIVHKTHMGRLRPALERALDLREGLSRLSPRQVEVLRLVADGHTTPAIAEKLGISVKTAETHRTEMMRRLDLHDVASLVRYAVQVRLIPRPG
jgi:DNA-binding NarL/FixJ family response regulator